MAKPHIHKPFSDAEFMPGREKAKVARHFDGFITGLQKPNAHRATAQDPVFRDFTPSLYAHLHLHCGFIAHYNRSGFYGTYFNGNVNALKQFMGRFISVDDATPKKRDDYVMRDERYEDINDTLATILIENHDGLVREFEGETKVKELGVAFSLLDKYGLKAAQECDKHTEGVGLCNWCDPNGYTTDGVSSA